VYWFYQEYIKNNIVLCSLQVDLKYDVKKFEADLNKLLTFLAGKNS